MRALSLFLCAVVTSAAADDRIGGSLGFASDYRIEGLSQSSNHPAFQGEVHLQSNPGGRSSWFAGLWGSSVRIDGADNGTLQLEPFVGHGWAFDADWQLRLTLSHYAHPWSKVLKQYDYDEVTAGIAWRDSVSVTVAWSPNTDLFTRYGFGRNGVSVAYEASVHAPVHGSFAVFAGLGYRDLRDLFDTGYWYGSAGVSYDRARLHATLMRVETDSTARELFYGDIARPAWVGSLLWTF